MKYNCILVPPLTVTNEHIVSGPPDAENQVYASDVTYSEGARVWYGGHWFDSLVDDNVGNTPAEGAFWTDKGEIDRGAIKWTAGSHPLEAWRVHNGRVWRSAKDNNTTEPGDTSTPELADDWQDYGPTTRLLPFDGFINRVATGPGPLKWVIDYPGRVTQMAFFKPGGNTINITAKVDGVPYDTRAVRASQDSGGGPWRYFFSPVVKRSTVLAQDFAPVGGARFTIEFTGGTASIGLIVAGFGDSVGVVLNPSGVGGRNFSDVEFDRFGNVEVQTSPNQRLPSFTVRAYAADGGRIFDVISARFGKPTLLFMRDGTPFGMVGYGYIEDVYPAYGRAKFATYTIDMKGVPE